MNLLCYIYDVRVFLIFSLLFWLYIADLFLLMYMHIVYFNKRSMEGRRSQGCEGNHGCGACSSQGPREEREVIVEQQHEPRAKVGDQIAMTIQRITYILVRLVKQ